MHMSFEEPEEMDPVINPELKEKALKEMREWGTDLKEGATLEGLLESNIRGARNVLRTPAPSGTMSEARRKIILAAFHHIGISKPTSKDIVADIEKSLGH